MHNDRKHMPVSGGTGGDWKHRIEQATIRFAKLGGRGVLVPGGFIITAAHCIDWEGHGAMALGDHFVEMVKTESGAELLLATVAVEPVADIAVLGAPDDQEFYHQQHEAFQEWIEVTAPVALSGGFKDWCSGTPERGTEQSFAVHVMDHLGAWVRGELCRYQFENEQHRAWMKMPAPIRGGASGGPIVDDAGRLVGVVSSTHEVEDNMPCDGMQPVAGYALPIWVLDRIRAA